VSGVSGTTDSRSNDATIDRKRKNVEGERSAGWRSRRAGERAARGTDAARATRSRGGRTDERGRGGRDRRVRHRDDVRARGGVCERATRRILIAELDDGAG
jgi:hypothetical protein